MLDRLVESVGLKARPKRGAGPGSKPAHRVIVGLQWVQRAQSPFHGKPRARGTKALGHKFERQVGERLKLQGYSPLLGQWFRFRDANGTGFCQPDIMLDLGSCIAVLECKLTDTDGARTQLELLYRPVVSMAFERPVRLITVTRHLTRETKVDGIVTSLKAALAIPAGCIPTLHWMGVGPI